MVSKSRRRKDDRKRKTGHLGFEANEIAFIEDEMAVLANEYGLELDVDVATHVAQRKQNKKTRRHQESVVDQFKSTETVSERKKTSGVSVKLLDVTTMNDVININVAVMEDVLEWIDRVLPETWTVRACSVPGCSCLNGSRVSELSDNNDTNQTNVISNAQCLTCHHKVLQHSIQFQDDLAASSTVPISSIGGQTGLQMLFQLIRFGRISASIVKNNIWTKCAVDQLALVLTRLRRQFLTGGTQNGQQSMKELDSTKQLVLHLQMELRKAQQALETAGRDSMPIVLACIYDRMYFHTSYTCLVLYGRACGAVPSPEIYLKDLGQCTPASTLQLEKFLNCELVRPRVPSRLLQSLALPIISSTSQGELERQRLCAARHENDNPLLAIYHLRLREGMRLFYEEGVGMNGEMDAVVATCKGKDVIASKKSKGSKKPQKKHYRRERNNSSRAGGEVEGASSSTLVEMPCYPLLAEWRNTCRDWCCHLYAYATPTQEALDVMAKYAPIVEIGAGTGYWSKLLQRADVDVVAYDKAPPSAEGVEGNVYHGHVPPFCSVGRGGPDVLSQKDMAGRTLFLCYPPPGDAMAARSVQLFQGDVILHVGEWQGDTGDTRFENELQRRFVLEAEIALPNWGNSAYGLTVWRRKSKDVKPIAWRAMSCFYCDKTLAAAVADGEPLRRCVVCKTNVYCSSICAQQDAVGHAAEHAVRLVFLKDPTTSAAYDRMFNSDAFYRKLREPVLDDTGVAFQSNWNALVNSESAAQYNTRTDANEEKCDERYEEDSDSQAQSAQSTTKAAFAFNFGS